MVFTTLDFAEKYLLKTEIRSVAAMPGIDSDFESDDAAGLSDSQVTDDYRSADEYAEGAY